jgi:hypothetical protein
VKGLAFAVVVLAAVGGVAFADSIKDCGKLNGLKEGTTTSEEVVTLLGKPTREIQSSDGRFIYTYTCRDLADDGPREPLVLEVTFIFDHAHHLVRVSFEQDRNVATY